MVLVSSVNQTRIQLSYIRDMLIVEQTKAKQSKAKRITHESDESCRSDEPCVYVVSNKYHI